jgi:hypothetical protein
MLRLGRVRYAIVICVGLLSVPADGAKAQFVDAGAETASTGDGSYLLTPEELNVLVAPVALYPDDLLAIVLPAATNPIQVVEAQRFLEQQKTDQSLQPDESWDPSIIALVNYPDVVKKLSDDISWCQDLGNALLDQQEDVLNAIQVARESAADAGYLQSNEQVTVVNEGDYVTIESADPEVIYVPQYDPAPVIYNNYTEYPPPYYGNPYPPYWGSTATFFAGAFVGAAFAYGFDWDNGDIDIDNDINVSRGDTNIGSGNRVEHHNVDNTKLQNKFSGERKANSDKMKWSGQKARQKSSTTRKATTGKRLDSATIQNQLGQKSPAQFQASGVKNNKASQTQSQRGKQSLSQGSKDAKQVRQNNVAKQDLRKQQRQPTAQQNQVRQKKPNNGGAFAGQGGRQVKQQSARGNGSMNRSKGGGGRPPKARGGRR